MNLVCRRQFQIAAGKRHTGKHVALGLLLSGNAWPLYLVANPAFLQLSNAGAASSVATGAQPLATAHLQ